MELSLYMQSACEAQDGPPLVCVDSLPFNAPDGRRTTTSQFQVPLLCTEFLLLLRLPFRSLFGSSDLTTNNKFSLVPLCLPIVEQLRLDFPKSHLHLRSKAENPDLLMSIRKYAQVNTEHSNLPRLLFLILRPVLMKLSLEQILSNFCDETHHGGGQFWHLFWWMDRTLRKKVGRPSPGVRLDFGQFLN